VHPVSVDSPVLVAVSVRLALPVSADLLVSVAPAVSVLWVLRVSVDSAVPVLLEPHRGCSPVLVDLPGFKLELAGLHGSKPELVAPFGSVCYKIE
jgi:hypothetical protein